MVKWFVCIVIIVSVQCAFARTDLNAFLDTDVHSVPQLVNEVKNNDRVANRYIRFYALTKNEVIERLQALHVKKLDAPMNVVMYSVPDSGKIKFHNATLRKGELIFVNAQGQPELRLICGNPIVPAGESAFTLPAILTPKPTLTFEAMEPTPIENFKATQITPDLTALVPNLPGVPESVPITPNSPVVTDVSVPPPSQISLSTVVPLLLGGGAFVSVHNGGSQSPPQAVPSPMGVFILGIGVLGLVGKQLRK